MRLRLSLFATAITAALMLTACGGESSQVASERFTRGIGSQPKSIDPQKVEGTWANDVIGDMFIGLYTEDAKSQPIPGVVDTASTSMAVLAPSFIIEPLPNARSIWLSAASEDWRSDSRSV